MLRIPWTSKVTNKMVLERVKTKILLEEKKKKSQSSGSHTLVMQANYLETTSMLGIVSGMSRRGRQRTRWLDIIKADMNMPIKEWKEAVKDHKAWGMMIHKVTVSRPRLNG